MSLFEKLLFPLTWLLNHTIYYIYSLICWLLSNILPSTFTHVFIEFKDLFWNGIVTTMYIALFSTILGLVIACLFGTILTIKVNNKDSKLVRMVKKILQSIIKIYVTIFRGTPMMVQAMIIYYGLYKLIKLQPFDAAMITVTINTGAYLTEVIRSSLESIDKGQTEAARSLGFSYTQTLFKFIFPQAMKNAMASIGNEFVINIKDTSVLNVIVLPEMFYILNSCAGRFALQMETMIAGAIIYLILTYSTTKLLKYIEKRLDVPLKELPSAN